MPDIDREVDVKARTTFPIVVFQPVVAVRVAVQASVEVLKSRLPLSAEIPRFVVTSAGRLMVPAISIVPALSPAAPKLIVPATSLSVIDGAFRLSPITVNVPFEDAVRLQLLAST